jgi:hypothetical protein
MSEVRARRREHGNIDLVGVLRTGLAPECDFMGNRLLELDMGVLGAAWEASREQIIAEHLRDHPHEMPWGWWVFSAEGQRLLAEAGRQWPLNVIGWQGGVEIRNRCAIPEFVQRELLAAAGLLTPSAQEQDTVAL